MVSGNSQELNWKQASELFGVVLCFWRLDTLESDVFSKLLLNVF